MFASLSKRRRAADEFSAKVYEITCSESFHASEVVGKRIHLSQAFMLLWQDWFTGDVDGLWTNSCLLAAVYSCTLLELIALGKIALRRKSKFGGAIISVKVIDKDFTYSHLDQATFCDLLRLANENDDAQLAKCISQAAKWKYRSKGNCATVILDSLEEMKILKRERECFGLSQQYRTAVYEPYGLLLREIRMIVLKSRVPDCYMRILLTLVHLADSYASKSDKLLKRLFTKKEYLAANEHIETLTGGWNVKSKGNEER